MERHVLVVLPHPDDESFGAAGTIAQFTQKGVPLTYACLTLGEMGRNMGKPFFANRETLPQIRKKELEDACRALGITDLRLMGMHDKMLEFEDPEAFADRISGLIRELDPSLIITFYPGHGFHPDHDACAAAVVRAVSRLPEDKEPRIYGIAVQEASEGELGPPDVTVDVRDVLDKKIAAIRAHRTQFEGILKRFVAETDFDNPKLRKWLGTEHFWIV